MTGKPQRLPHALGAIGSLSSILALSSCGIFGPSRESFLVRVDSIGPISVSGASEPLTAQFHGWIGPDGCSWLARVERQATSSSLDATFHGAREVGGGDCTTAPVALNHAEVVAPPLETPFTITVHQPDGSLLRRVVTVP